MPIIDITNTNIAPWSEVHPRCRSSQINALRQKFKNSSIKRNLLNFNRLFNNAEEANHYDTDIYRKIARDLSLSQNCFPPIRRTFDRIWRDYILPCSTFIDTQTVDSRYISIGDKIKFHEFYRDLRELKSEDFYTYKYCVIIAGFNILKKVYFFGNPIYHSISYVCLENILQECICSRIGRTSYKISIRPDVFLNLINLIPIFEIDSYESSYYNFWNKLGDIYYNSPYNDTYSFVQSSNRIPLLTEEYQNRTDDKKSFISKKQIISMIEMLYVPDNALNSIYDIMQSIDNK